MQTLVPHLAMTGLGKTVVVPVDVNPPLWTPRQCLLNEFDEVVPTAAPFEWIAQHLEMVTVLVPWLVHIDGDVLGDRTKENWTYVQIARLNGGISINNDDQKEYVLLVGQRDSWVVIDPLSSEGDEDVPDVVGRRLAGVIRAPRGVTSRTDRGFALMTWIRDVFVHGLPIDKVNFRGQPDRVRCTLEHHLRCFFHS